MLRMINLTTSQKKAYLLLKWVRTEAHYRAQPDLSTSTTEGSVSPKNEVADL